MPNNEDQHTMVTITIDIDDSVGGHQRKQRLIWLATNDLMCCAVLNELSSYMNEYLQYLQLYWHSFMENEVLEN